MFNRPSMNSLRSDDLFDLQKDYLKGSLMKSEPYDTSFSDMARDFSQNNKRPKKVWQSVIEGLLSGFSAGHKSAQVKRRQEQYKNLYDVLSMVDQGTDAVKEQRQAAFAKRAQFEQLNPFAVQAAALMNNDQIPYEMKHQQISELFSDLKKFSPALESMKFKGHVPGSTLVTYTDDKGSVRALDIKSFLTPEQNKELRETVLADRKASHDEAVLNLRRHKYGLEAEKGERDDRKQHLTVENTLRNEYETPIKEMHNIVNSVKKMKRVAEETPGIFGSWYANLYNSMSPDPSVRDKIVVEASKGNLTDKEKKNIQVLKKISEDFVRVRAGGLQRPNQFLEGIIKKAVPSVANMGRDAFLEITGDIMRDGERDIKTMIRGAEDYDPTHDKKHASALQRRINDHINTYQEQGNALNDGSSSVSIMSPDGKRFNVPKEKLNYFLSQGFKGDQ